MTDYPSFRFGDVAACRGCHGTGLARGSGMDDRQRAELRRAGEPIPTMHRCEECGGRGVLPTRLADRVPAGPADVSG